MEPLALGALLHSWKARCRLYISTRSVEYPFGFFLGFSLVLGTWGQAGTAPIDHAGFFFLCRVVDPKIQDEHGAASLPSQRRIASQNDPARSRISDEFGSSPLADFQAPISKVFRLVSFGVAYESIANGRRLVVIACLKRHEVLPSRDSELDQVACAHHLSWVMDSKCPE